MLFFDHHPNIKTRDGSYECDIVYANLSEAKRAVRISNTTLGDRTFTVSLVTDPTRFRLRTASERLRHCEAASRTAYVYGLPRSDIEELMALCGGAEVVSAVQPINENSALVEFVDRPSMFLGFERLKVATIEGVCAKVEEAWRRVDPDYHPVMKEQERRKSEENRANTTVDRRDHRDKRDISRERRRSRSRDQQYSRSRSHRDRDREREWSRSRSPRRRHRSHRR